MNRDVCEHFNPVDLPCEKCQGEPMTTLRQAAQQALEALEADCGGRCNAEYNPCWQREVAETLRAALAEPVQEPVQEPVAFITPLMEQQMFDDWCPYKGSPDPRTVWAAAVDSVNGLLLGASPPEEIEALFEAELLALPPYPSATEELPVRLARAIERAHGIGNNT